MQKIGFIGLGHMGHPMVINLLKAGYEVKIFDLQKEAMESLASHGAIVCGSVIETVKNSEIMITMLQTGDQVKSVCLGEQGFFNSIDKKSLYIDCSSIDINDSRFLHQEADKIGLAMVDAPVSGGVKGAEVAGLTIMVGGEEKNFRRAETILSLLGKNIIHAGSAGNGQAAKICNNMILGISMIAVSEAFNLGKKLGLDPKKLFEISSKASGQCWSMTSYCPEPNLMENVPSNNHYQPGFASNMMLKDLKLSQAAATSVSVSTPLGASAMDLYQQFVDAGFDQKDFSGIIKWLKK